MSSGSRPLGPPPPPRPRFVRLRTGLRDRRLWVAGVAGVAAVAAATFLASRPEKRWTEPPALDPPVGTLEARWLREADAWLAWVEDARLDPQHLAVQRCGREFDRTVGVPPSERLDAFAALFRELCRTFRDSGRHFIRAETNVEAELLDVAEAEESEGLRLVALAKEGLRSTGVRTAAARSRIVPQYSRAASLLVGQPVEAHCWQGANWRRVTAQIFKGRVEPEGFAGVYDPEGRIHLSPYACDALSLVDRAPQTLSHDELLDLAYGVGLLAHEAEHSAGRSSEAVAECYGMQKIRVAARALGATRSLASELAETYWRELYSGSERVYGSAQCRDGGRLDLRLETTVWP